MERLFSSFAYLYLDRAREFHGLDVLFVCVCVRWLWRFLLVYKVYTKKRVRASCRFIGAIATLPIYNRRPSKMTARAKWQASERERAKLQVVWANLLLVRSFVSLLLLRLQIFIKHTHTHENSLKFRSHFCAHTHTQVECTCCMKKMLKKANYTPRRSVITTNQLGGGGGGTRRRNCATCLFASREREREKSRRCGKSLPQWSASSNTLLIGRRRRLQKAS